MSLMTDTLTLFDVQSSVGRRSNHDKRTTTSDDVDHNRRTVSRDVNRDEGDFEVDEDWSLMTSLTVMMRTDLQWFSDVTMMRMMMMMMVMMIAASAADVMVCILSAVLTVIFHCHAGIFSQVMTEALET